MANLHASLDSTWKSRISKNFHQMSDLGGSIPRLFILNSEMNLKISNPGGVHSTEWAHSQDLTLFPFCCVYHHRSFLTEDQQSKLILRDVIRSWIRTMFNWQHFTALAIISLCRFPHVHRCHSRPLLLLHIYALNIH